MCTDSHLLVNVKFSDRPRTNPAISQLDLLQIVAPQAYNRMKSKTKVYYNSKANVPEKPSFGIRRTNGQMLTGIIVISKDLLGEVGLDVGGTVDIVHYPTSQILEIVKRNFGYAIRKHTVNQGKIIWSIYRGFGLGLETKRMRQCDYLVMKDENKILIFYK